MFEILVGCAKPAFNKILVLRYNGPPPACNLLKNRGPTTERSHPSLADERQNARCGGAR
jgi:hypothetical protein